MFYSKRIKELEDDVDLLINAVTQLQKIQIHTLLDSKNTVEPAVKKKYKRTNKKCQVFKDIPKKTIKDVANRLKSNQACALVTRVTGVSETHVRTIKSNLNKYE